MQGGGTAMFWLMAVAMAVVVAMALLRPFLGRNAGRAEPPAAYDLRVYRDQLREVDRDLARRVLTPEEAERLRTEIGRKILDADRALARQVAPSGGAARPGLIAALLVLLLGAGAAVYWRMGDPAAPDLPLKARIAAAEARLADRPAQADAEARVPAAARDAAAAATTPDPEYLRLIEALRTAVTQRPNDPEGLALLAEHEGRLGNLAAARDAQARLIAVKGAGADALDHARLAGIMIEAAGGTVSKEAAAELERALERDPRNGQALYLKGLMLAQNDRPDLAFPIWRDLAERGPADAPWMAPIAALMPQLAWLAGHPDYQLPGTEGATGAPGPDAAAVAAAGEMTPEERQQMIAGMVAQLEARLATEGGTPEEWGRLITSLVRVGNAAHAAEIWAEAQARFATRPEALAVVTAAAAEVGLRPGASGAAGNAGPAGAPAGAPDSGAAVAPGGAQAGAPGGTSTDATSGAPTAAPATATPAAALPGPDAAAVAAAGQMSDADRQEMIAGMVARLESRLTSQGGTGEEWARLVGALAVLGETGRAADMLARGRAALAGDPGGLAALDDAAARAGVK